MQAGKCPKCSRTGTTFGRGTKTWTERRQGPDGGDREVVIAIDYYWCCDVCGERFTEREELAPSGTRDRNVPHNLKSGASGRFEDHAAHV
jgi:hypothetical protein